MVQPGTSDYRTAQGDISEREQTQGVLDQVREYGERAETMTEEFAAAIRRRPYATLAVAVSLAFPVGALWKLGHRRPQTRLEAPRAQLPDVRTRLPSWNALQRSWH